MKKFPPCTNISSKYLQQNISWQKLVSVGFVWYVLHCLLYELSGYIWFKLSANICIVYSTYLWRLVYLQILAVQVFSLHDDVIKWKHFPRYWPFVRGIHWSLVDSPHKCQWRRALMSSLICVWTNGWVNNWDTGLAKPLLELGGVRMNNHNPQKINGCNYLSSILIREALAISITYACQCKWIIITNCFISIRAQCYHTPS